MGRASRRKQDAAPPAQPAAGSAPASPSVRRTPRPRPAGALLVWLAPLAIVAVGLLAYANSFAVPFLFDDYFEIVDNPRVRILEPLGSYLTRSRGLTFLTFVLNVRAGGLDVWGFHLVNVGIHLANALLVFALVRYTLRLPRWAGRYTPRAEWLALLVALIFVAHPLQTMAATYLVQRAESLAALFYLLTLLLFAYGTGAERPRRRLAWLGLAGVSALLGVMSKEIVATVPLAAALYWQCFRAGAQRPAWWRRLAVLALLSLPLVYGLVLARHYLLPGTPDADPDAPRAWLFIPTAGFGLEGVGPWQYLLTQFGVIVWYLRLFAVPVGQVFDYGWPLADSPWTFAVLAPLAVLLAIAAVAVAAWRRYPLATFCLGWVFITLAPSSSIVPLRDAAFEHRMYLPVIGLAWLLVVGLDDLLARVAPARGWSLAGLRRLAGGAALAWVALLVALTVQRNAVLAEPLRLAAVDAARAPHHWRVHFQHGDALLRAERTDEAVAALEEAIRLDPRQGAPRVTLGSIYVRQRRWADAERVLEPATALREESVVAAAHQQLAAVYHARGELDRSATALRRALALRPQWSSLSHQLASIYARQGRWVYAARYYGAALQANPRLRGRLAAPAAEADYRAALRYAAQGKTPSARNLLIRALELQPNLVAARRALAVVAAAEGDWSRADAVLAELARRDPGDPWVAESRARVARREPLQLPQ